jgi:hypothetical protein
MIERGTLLSDLPERGYPDDPRGGSVAWALLAVAAILVTAILLTARWVAGSW